MCKQINSKKRHNYKKGQIIIVNESLYVAINDFTSTKIYNSQNWVAYTKHEYSVFNSTHTWVEFLNRLLGAVAGFVTLLLFITSIFKFKKDYLKYYFVIFISNYFYLLFNFFVSIFGLESIKSLNFFEDVEGEILKGNEFNTKIININIVNDVYKIKILAACFKISELLNDIKFVKVFLKLS